MLTFDVCDVDIIDADIIDADVTNNDVIDVAVSPDVPHSVGITVFIAAHAGSIVSTQMPSPTPGVHHAHACGEVSV